MTVLRPTKFHQTWTILVELGRHITFSRWRPCRRKSTSGFGFSDVTYLTRLKHLGTVFRALIMSDIRHALWTWGGLLKNTDAERDD